MISKTVQPRAAAPQDSLPDLDGIPFVPPLVSLNFRCWLIWCSIGHGSRDAKLSKAAVHPKAETISRPLSGARGVMTTCCRLDISYVLAIPPRPPVLHNILMTHS